MPYTALYRKLRPLKFADVVGQGHIVRTLINQLTSRRVPHAYLFCGTRGTGKTTVARIFARALNCENPSGGEPCNACETCLDILKQRSMNVIEIDAASNNGVDDIRELREEVRYSPPGGVYKVYIVDEVHMLSGAAFNALLKTLEEPPEYVFFILATTDPQKIPATVHSRCQRFDFKRVSRRDMAAALTGYMREEGVMVDDAAIDYVARVSDGSMRDAISVLDQCASFYQGETITLAKTLDMLGAADDGAFFDLTDAIMRCDNGKCMAIIDAQIKNGVDIQQFAHELTAHLRDVLVVKASGGTPDDLDMSADRHARLKEQGAVSDALAIIAYIDAFSENLGQMRYSLNPRLLLEVCCIKLCCPETEDSGAAIYTRLNKLEQRLEAGPAAKAAPETSGELLARIKELEIAVDAVKNKPVDTEKKTAKPKPRPKAVPDDILRVKENWGRFVEKFGSPAMEMLKNAIVETLDDDAMYIVFPDAVSGDLMTKNLQIIIETLEAEFGKNYHVVCISSERFAARRALTYGEPDADAEGLEQVIKNINFDVEII